MTVSRVFVDLALPEGREVQLPPEVGRHVAQVLRMRVDDPLIVFNGRGGEYGAHITSIHRGDVTVVIENHRPVERESPLTIVLAQGISRGERMDLTIQKAVELGVRQIVPVTTSRSTVRLNDARRETRLAHWRKITVSACEQCGRNRLPTLSPIGNLADWLSESHAGSTLVLDPQALSSVSALPPPEQGITLLIGPEGGLSGPEIESAEAHGFLPIGLGPRILRTETAALAAISILQSHFGDLA